MSLIDSHDLQYYRTREELEGLLGTIEYEMSTLRGFQRGAEEKLQEIEDNEPEDDEDE